MPEERLLRHNKGDVYSTKFGRPWRLLYSEVHLNMQLAWQGEKQIKSWKRGNAFRKLLSKNAGSSNGRTSDSGSGNLGSSPSPAARVSAVSRPTEGPILKLFS